MKYFEHHDLYKFSNRQTDRTFMGVYSTVVIKSNFLCDSQNKMTLHISIIFLFFLISRIEHAWMSWKSKYDMTNLGKWLVRKW